MESDCEKRIRLEKDKDVFKSWVTAVLPSNKLDEYNYESVCLQDLICLGDSTIFDWFPIHQLLHNILKKIAMSEAAVERSFSRHRLIHSRLRASWHPDNDITSKYSTLQTLK